MRDLTGKQVLRLRNIRPHLVHMLAEYVSPDEEHSIAKGLPLEELPLARELNRVLPIRIKYRGPRPKGQGRNWMTRKSTCLKKDATSFTIYPK